MGGSKGCGFFFLSRTVRSNSRMKPSTTPSTEKESTTNDNGSSTDDAESEGNNRLVLENLSAKQTTKIQLPFNWSGR